MSDYIDVTAQLHDRLPSWPTSIGFQMTSEAWEEDGDVITNSSITTDVHAGTHVDAPSHFLRDGAELEELGIESFIGEAYVAEVPGSVRVIDGSTLSEAGIPDDTERLLIKTANQEWWPDAEGFNDDYVALDESGARWCVERGFVLVGIDYLSIQAQRATAETHRSLMRAGIVILEGLDLRTVTEGFYELICLPIRIADAEGAPVRAVLRQRSNGARL